MQRGPQGKAQPRHSARIEKVESVRVLDEVARNKRLKRQLEALDHDNAHEDPHANIVWHKAIPKFEDNVMITSAPGGNQRGRKREVAIASDEPTKKKKKKVRPEYTKQRFKKNFFMLVEEESQANKEDPYLRYAFVNAAAPPSKLPAKHYCAACGFPSKYTCVRCGARYCCIRCRDVHVDTRCMKYIM